MEKVDSMCYVRRVSKSKRIPSALVRSRRGAEMGAVEYPKGEIGCADPNQR